MPAAVTARTQIVPRAAAPAAGRGAAALRKYARAARVAASVPLYRLAPDKQAYGRWLRDELEAIGCLFVKMGQWVASREDLFPRDVTTAFSALQTDVSPMPPAALAAVLAAEGAGLDWVDPAPLSSGSVAQVHRARWRGREVAVKVQRPHLALELGEDLGLMRALLWPLKWRERKTYDDAIKSLDELGTTIAAETDFAAEAAHMRRFGEFFATDPGVRVPALHWHTPRLIVMEYVPSAPLEPDAAGPGLPARLMDLFLTQFFELGYVHTDLHAGNLGLAADGALVMYDFGSVMECPPGMQACIKALFVNYLNANPGVMLDYMTETGVLTSREPLTPAQRATLERFIATVVQYVENTDIRRLREALSTIPVPDTLPDVEFRPEVFMVCRSFSLLEGVCKRLDPGFVILDAMLPFAARLVADPDMYALKIEDDLRAVTKTFLDLFASPPPAPPPPPPPAKKV